MIGVHTAVLRQMRAAAESLMTDTCTIEALAQVRGPAGEQINAWSTVDSAVKCRLITESRRNQGEVLIMAEQASLPDRYRVVLPHDTTVSAGYRITLDSDSSQWIVSSSTQDLTSQVSVTVTVVPESV